MHIDMANIKNLTHLWHKYGAQNITPDATLAVMANTHWPHRSWQPDTALNSAYAPSNMQWLEDVPTHATLPIWPLPLHDQTALSIETEQRLIDQGWHCAFEQTAMYLALSNLSSQAFDIPNNFKIEVVRTPAQLATWVEVASIAFGYKIEQRVFAKLLADSSIQMLLGILDDQPVATALLFEDEYATGLHQMGVAPGFQGRGIAKIMLHEVIRSCLQSNAQYIVLQASQAGKPLYARAGFNNQFKIKNYQRK